MKRLTKAQREAADIAAIEKRLRDIWITAVGWSMDEIYQPCPEELVRIIRGAINCLGINVSEEGTPQVVAYWSLHEWESPKKAAAFLYRQGVSA